MLKQPVEQTVVETRLCMTKPFSAISLIPAWGWMKEFGGSICQSFLSNLIVVTVSEGKVKRFGKGIHK